MGTVETRFSDATSVCYRAMQSNQGKSSGWSRTRSQTVGSKPVMSYIAYKLGAFERSIPYCKVGIEIRGNRFA